MKHLYRSVFFIIIIIIINSSSSSNGGIYSVYTPVLHFYKHSYTDLYQEIKMSIPHVQYTMHLIYIIPINYISLKMSENSIMQIERV